MNRLCSPQAVAWAAATLCALMASAHAQPTAEDTSAETLPAVRITGTSLRRIDAETALPVIVLRRADIERSGARTTTELLQQLPVMQGAVQTSAVVGTDARGYASVSIHNLGDAYTLVLLNGQRVAPFGGQLVDGGLSSVDINTIPLAIIERIEVLTDGASALYGADALGGVVNIITKRDGDANEATIGVTVPRGGAREWRFSGLKSIGQLSDADGQNLSLAASAMRRSALQASERDYARDAIKDFYYRGRPYRFADVNDTSAPATIYDGGFGWGNPMLSSTGSCARGSYKYNNPYDATVFTFPLCSYNYAADVDLVPEQRQHSLFTSFTRRLSGDNKLSLDALLSRSVVTSHLAPVTSGTDSVAVSSSSPTYSKYLSGLGVSDDPTYVSYRFVDLGRREFEDTSDLVHLSAKLEGQLAAWAWSAALTYSLSHQQSDVAHILSATSVNQLFANGLVNPVVAPGNQTPAELAALRAASYSGEWLAGRSTLAALNWQASRDVMPLPGGPLKVSVGADVRRERLSFQPSLFAQGLLADPSTGALALAPDVANVPVDTAALMQPATASRYVWGAFTEWLAPVTSTWDLGAAVRSDHDSMSGDAVTGKVLTRWKLSPAMLWRASLGTGFKAPTLNQLSVPTQSFYMDKPKCTSALQGAQGSLGLSQCLEPSIVSVPVLATSNSALKPEHSLQGSLGLKIEPIAGHTVGFDIWAVQIHDRIGTVSPDTIYANPAAYPDLVTTAQTSNGLALAVLTKPINFQSRLTRGMDVEAGVMRGSPLGLIDSQLRLTTIYRDDAQAYPGGPWVSSIGDAADQGATLKWRGSWRTSLIHAGWTNTLTMRYQSGYLAKGITAYPLDQSGQTMAAAETIRLKVSGQVLWDWQTSWQISSVLQVTAGVVNVFDTKPPLALNSVDGANKGQQIGYDERYFDPRGRMLMLEAKLSF